MWESPMADDPRMDATISAPPPPLPVVGTAAAPVGFSAAQLQELADARLRAKKLRRACSMAAFDGWATAIFAALSLVGGLVSLSVSGLLVGAGLATIAYVEFRGRAMLRRLDDRAPSWLGYNQVGFAGLLIVYALWNLWSIHHDPSQIQSAVASDPQLAEMLGPIEDMVRLVFVLVYVTLIAVAVFVQGGTAWFYFSRAKHLRAYLAQTPEWILAMHRAGIPVW
jgi:hypothetical protein